MVIKIAKNELIRSMGEHMRLLNDKHRKELDEYPGKMEAFKKSIAERLEKIVKQVREGNFSSFENGYGNPRLEFKERKPERPQPPGELCRLQGNLSRIRLSQQDVLSFKDGDEMLNYLDGAVCKRIGRKR